MGNYDYEDCLTSDLYKDTKLSLYIIAETLSWCYSYFEFRSVLQGLPDDMCDKQYSFLLNVNERQCNAELR